MSSRGRAEIDPAGGQEYAAAALSLVFHSAHPLVPTLRADVRLFQVNSPRIQQDPAAPQHRCQVACLLGAYTSYAIAVRVIRP
jgi:hypothetical protein